MTERLYPHNFCNLKVHRFSCQYKAIKGPLSPKEPISLSFKTKYEAPPNVSSEYLLRSLRQERNPAEAENSSHSFFRLSSRFSAKADKAQN